MIDSEGYRANVGIIVSNAQHQVLWCRRAGQDAWQFPQGGIEENELPEDALYRELQEETGLSANDVMVLGQTGDWLKYEIPEGYLRKDRDEACLGQKQLWFLLKLREQNIELNLARTESSEFDGYEWVDYWYPYEHVIPFKKDVYLKALRELESFLLQDVERSRRTG